MSEAGEPATRIAQLVAAVPPDVADVIDARWRDWQGEPAGFLAALLDEGVISADTLGDATDAADGQTDAADLHAPRTFADTAWPDEPEPDPNTRLPDTSTRWTLLHPLAEGAMGEVWSARDDVLGRDIAVKRVHASRAHDPAFVRRFINEARVTAQLHHPNIVPIHALSLRAGEAPAYAMKLVEGRTLADVIEAARTELDDGRMPTGALSLDARLELFLKVCDAMAYAHARGVVHRDLKPDNIMVGRFGEVYVMDWGIARGIGTPEADDAADNAAIHDGSADGQHGRIAVSARGTAHGALLGTPAYMSPEQAKGHHDALDGRSDQFALGLVLFELVTLRHAIRRDHPLDMLLRVEAAKLEPMVGYHARLRAPRALVGIVHRACARDKHDRYSDTTAFANDIRRFLRDDEVLAAPDDSLRRFTRWVGRHRTLAAVSVLMVLLASSLVALGGVLRASAVQRDASRREESLSGVFLQVSASAHRLDRVLAEAEGQLHVVAATALEVLARDADELGPASASYFLGPSFYPPDLTDSPAYGRPVSLGWPTLTLAPRTSIVQAETSIRQLTLLRQPLRRLLAQSIARGRVVVGNDAHERRLIDEGGPISWVYIGLDNGVFLGYPGHAGYPPGYDARREDWFRLAERATGITWGRPSIDGRGQGIVLPVSMPLIDDGGKRVGVASLELSVDAILRAVNTDPRLTDDAELFLLDERGRVLVRGRDQQRALEPSPLGVGRRLRARAFPDEAVAEAVRDGQSGLRESITPDGTPMLTVFERLDLLGWTVALRGPTDVLLGEG